LFEFQTKNRNVQKNAPTDYYTIFSWKKADYHTRVEVWMVNNGQEIRKLELDLSGI
jgi:hypothetical protein